MWSLVFNELVRFEPIFVVDFVLHEQTRSEYFKPTFHSDILLDSNETFRVDFVTYDPTANE